MEEIRKQMRALISARPPMAMERRHEFIPKPDKKRICVSEIVIRGQAIVIVKNAFNNINGMNSQEILEEFFKAKDVKSFGKKVDPETSYDPNKIQKFSVSGFAPFFKSATTDEAKVTAGVAAVSNQGANLESQFDFEANTGQIMLYDIQVTNLFFSPKLINFHDPDLHKYYVNCRDDGTKSKRCSFSIVGDDKHAEAFKESPKHKFDIHFVLTAEDRNIPQDDRRLTEIIFDPKSEDAGIPN